MDKTLYNEINKGIALIVAQTLQERLVEIDDDPNNAYRFALVNDNKTIELTEIEHYIITLILDAWSSDVLGKDFEEAQEFLQNTRRTQGNGERK